MADKGNINPIVGKEMESMDVDGDEYLREMEKNLGINPLMPGEREERKMASQELLKTVLERARSE
jgi:hypothetical protein